MVLLKLAHTKVQCDSLNWMVGRVPGLEPSTQLLHVILQLSSVNAAAHQLSDAMLSAVQAFVQKLAVCLLDVDRDPNSPMVDQMNSWTAEATCFVSCSNSLHTSGSQSSWIFFAIAHAVLCHL